MILLPWNCRGLAQAESKRSLKAIVNKSVLTCYFCLKLKLVLIESNLSFIHWVSISSNVLNQEVLKEASFWDGKMV